MNAETYERLWQLLGHLEKRLENVAPGRLWDDSPLHIPEEFRFDWALRAKLFDILNAFQNDGRSTTEAVRRDIEEFIAG